MASELKCSTYEMYEGEDSNWSPCHCPICASFLKWNPDGMTCKKCGTELLVIPECDEETDEELECGKICPISLPKKEPKSDLLPKETN